MEVISWEAWECLKYDFNIWMCLKGSESNLFFRILQTIRATYGTVFMEKMYIYYFLSELWTDFYG